MKKEKNMMEIADLVFEGEYLNGERYIKIKK